MPLTYRRREYEAVTALVAKRGRYQNQRARFEVTPGREPLIGVATADDCATWHALGQHIANLDEQIAAIREAVAA